MRIRSDMRWGRINGVNVFEHSFGLAVAGPGLLFVPYCSCGWIGGYTAGQPEAKADNARNQWMGHLITKNMKGRE